MSKLLLNFAFATSLYSEKRNYLETFSPFVLQTLNSLNKITGAKDICDHLVTHSKLKIPTNTVRTILKTLSREGYAKEDYNNGGEFKSKITEKGKKYLREFTEEEDKIIRRHNELFKEFHLYLKNQNFEISFEKIEPEVIKFIHENLHYLTILNSTGLLDKKFADNLEDEIHLHLTSFITEIEHHNPKLYETFEELLKGAILWGHIANQEELPEKESAFEPLTVYLDANIILSLLDLHHPTINEAAIQLLKLLKEEKKITLKVLSLTLEEISRLLKTYKNQEDNYNINIGVNSIYYFLKSKGYNDIKTLDLIYNLDKRIQEKGITLEKRVLVEVDSLKKEDKELYRDLYSYNRQINEQRKEDSQKEENALHLSTLHDATIISHIKTKRGAWAKSLERSKAIFLTSSFRLDEFCKDRYRIVDNFPEVILDLTLTNILWLKNPKMDFGVQLHKLIAIHSKKMLIDGDIWRKFTNTLKDLHHSRDLTAQQYAVLFSSNQLTIDYLHNVKPNQINLSSLSELSQKIERDILKDKSSKIVKDNIIQLKNKELIKIQGEIESKTRELEEKDNLLLEKEKQIGSIVQKKDEKDIEIEKLKEEIKKENKKQFNSKQETHRNKILRSWKQRSFIPLGVSICVLFFILLLHDWNFNFLAQYFNKDTPEHIKTLCSIGIPIFIVMINIFVLGHIYMRYYNESNIKAKYDRIKLPDNLQNGE